MPLKHIPKIYRQNPRYQALFALDRVDKGSYSNLIVGDVITKANFSPEDANLFTELVYGTLAHKLTLRYQVGRFLQGNKKIESWVENVLLLGAFQMLYLDKVPDHAAINESVEMAKNLGHVGIGKLVNGVLRNLQRKGVSDLSELTDPAEHLEIAASFPRVLIDFLTPQLGFEATSALAFSLLTPSHASARVNPMKISQKGAVNALLEKGYDVEISPVAKAGIIAHKGFLAGSFLFKKGWLTIQDESSMLVAPAMQLAPDLKVLDACAAPGGKTTHIAQLLTTGTVTAIDLHAHKVKLIEENAERLLVADRVDTHVMDARTVDQNFPQESFDRVLVDAPCSGLGLMRRKPDIKYTKNPEDFLKLPAIQLDILESCARVLKIEGIMTYSTCTLTRQENQGVVENFLAHHPEFILEEVQVEGAQSLVKDKMLQLLPQDFQTDGFFISCLKKISETVS